MRLIDRLDRRGLFMNPFNVEGGGPNASTSSCTAVPDTLRAFPPPRLQEVELPVGEEGDDWLGGTIRTRPVVWGQASSLPELPSIR